MSYTDWSKLPKELIELIFDELQHAGDIIRFGTVCRFWGLVALEARQQVFKPLRPLSPMLLLPPNKDDEAHKLYDFFKKKAYKIQIPAMRDKWCCNSWNGWLITINHTFPYEIYSPPDLDETPIEFFLNKVVLSSTPSPSNANCVIMAIHSNYNKLAFCKPGDKRWITLKSEDIQYKDLLYYKDNFYAIGRSKVVQCDIGDDPRVIPFALLPKMGYFQYRYLVESSDCLLYVLRYLDLKDEEDPLKLRYETTGFKVFDLDSDKRKFSYRYETTTFKVYNFDFDQKKWKLVKNIKEKALLLGYFENTYGCHDMGVFNIKTHLFKPIFRRTQLWASPLFWMRPELSLH
ncbi:hypothetical protein AAG906_040947 [Vitis piasezkii]